MSQNENGNEICEANVIHVDTVEKVKLDMPEDEDLYELSDLFKVFGDSTRIKIICALFKEEMCVCDIAYLLQMKQSAISHQLKILRQSKLVKYRRAGKTVYYSLDDEHIKEIFNMGFMHIKEK
ncbi:ArsR/SmtB family transcription factor [Clostridium felsineum]|uniref:ArsR/SmtB family transcription factor n=1 Tax=Clostridium felsineum TaxID=36839 RepID=UPI00098C1D85|nr:metalloregulator ArsR/SmtB family transcription factor [Clostridium felsineum]URZ01015.1 Transcriptional repressor SmtB [Clostridium felsineum]